MSTFDDLKKEYAKHSELGFEKDTDTFKRVDLSELKYKKSQNATHFKLFVGMFYALLDLLELASEDGDIQFSAVFPKIVSTQAKMRSKGLVKFLRFWLGLSYVKLKEKLDYIKANEPDVDDTAFALFAMI